MTKTLNPDELEQRIRHTLSTVAATLTEDSPLALAPRQGRSKRRWRIGLGIGIGVVGIPLAFAAAALVREGSEYVDTIPPEDIIVTGSVDGSRYLLIESSRTDNCGNPVTGVELVEEKENLLGSEWNTVGSEYGEANSCGGVSPTARYLADPALYNDGGTTVGDSFVWMWAVHPDVTVVRITADDYSEDLPVYPVDGAGYALFEIPTDIDEYTAELLIDGDVVPGSAEEQTVPTP